MTGGCLRQDYSIGDVYSYGFEHEAAIYSLKNPPLRRFLHIRNFWQRHLLNAAEGTFHWSFANLPMCHRPKMLKDPTSSTTELSTAWLGYRCMYALSCLSCGLKTSADYDPMKHAFIPIPTVFNISKNDRAAPTWKVIGQLWSLGSLNPCKEDTALPLT